MKSNRSVWLALGLLIIVGAVCRVAGFAPQIAMGIFGAVVIKDKRLALLLPLFSMFLSDVLYEVMFQYGYSDYGGFYDGQLTNYILLAGVSLIGFWARNRNWARIAAVSLAAPTLFFLFSNFLTWANHAGLQRPMTFSGLMMCYNDAVPFFRSSLVNTVAFSAILFGGYFLASRLMLRKQTA